MPLENRAAERVWFQNAKILRKVSLEEAERYLMIICPQSRKSKIMLIK